MKLKDITFEKYKELFEKFIILIEYNDVLELFEGELMITPNEYINIDLNFDISNEIFNFPDISQYDNYFIDVSKNVYLIPLEYKNMILNDESEVAIEILLEKVKRKEFVNLK